MLSFYRWLTQKQWKLKKYKKKSFGLTISRHTSLFWIKLLTLALRANDYHINETNQGAAIWIPLHIASKYSCSTYFRLPESRKKLKLKNDTIYHSHRKFLFFPFCRTCRLADFQPIFTDIFLKPLTPWLEKINVYCTLLNILPIIIIKL